MRVPLWLVGAQGGLTPCELYLEGNVSDLNTRGLAKGLEAAGTPVTHCTTGPSLHRPCGPLGLPH